MRLPFGAGILNALPLSVGLALSLAVAATDVGAQSGERPLEIGLRGGVEVHRGGLGHEHLGLSAWIPVRDAFHVVPALDLLGDFPADPLGAWTGKALVRLPDAPHPPLRPWVAPGRRIRIGCPLRSSR